MKEELISFKTAKLAKEKGFISMQLNYALLNEGDVKFPTQSVLQKWLRKKHNIHIELVQTVEGKYTYNIKIAGCISRYGGVFDTYEETLETGLYESLELIK